MYVNMDTCIYIRTKRNPDRYMRIYTQENREDEVEGTNLKIIEEEDGMDSARKSEIRFSKQN